MAAIIPHPDTHYTTPEGMTIKAPFDAAYATILTKEALYFIRALHLRFNPHRQKLLLERKMVQEKIDTGWKPGFLPETEMIRRSRLENPCYLP